MKIYKFDTYSDEHKANATKLYSDMKGKAAEHIKAGGENARWEAKENLTILKWNSLSRRLAKQYGITEQQVGFVLDAVTREI